MITSSDFKHHIQSTKEFYEVLCRNGYYQPTFRSNAVNEAYMVGVMHKKVFCPKDDDIRFKNCFSQPTKDILIAKLMEVAEKKKWNLGFSAENKPDKAG